MKIENDGKINLIEQLIGTKKTVAEEGRIREKKEEIRDRVEISNQQEIRRLKKMVEEIPSVREERIERIKEAIEAKTYNVKGELVARSLLKAHLFEVIL